MVFRERQNGNGPVSAEEIDERLKALVSRVDEIIGSADEPAVTSRSGTGSGR